MKFFRKRKIQFTDRSHPFWGIVSAIIGIVSVVIMLSLFIGSGTQGGTAGISYGVPVSYTHLDVYKRQGC